MRVLIVEDDAALGLFLRKGLELQGHHVVLAADGRTGLQHALDNAPELMVLDLSLPGLDGVQVLEGLRGNLDSTSVLVLTARLDVAEKLRCLNLGADDFLTKPFSFTELIARCKGLLRRREQFADPLLRNAGVELHRMNRKVTRDGQAIDLTVKEFALLEYLMQARGRTCSRSELLQEVWQMSPEAGTNVVDVYVNYLRKKLGAARLHGLHVKTGTSDSAEVREQMDRTIDTVRGQGYCMPAVTGKRSSRSSGAACFSPGRTTMLDVAVLQTFSLGVAASA